MKTRYIFAAAVAAFALVACNKEIPAAENVEAEEIVFTLCAETRATEVTTSNLSTLYVTATTGSNSETSVFTSASYTKSGSVWKGGKFWPSTNPNYHFYLSNVALTHTSAGATVSPANANTDIVVDYIATPTFKATNTATLEHIFAQVGTVRVKVKAGYKAENIKISLQPKTSGTYNLKTDTWTPGNAGSATYILGTANAGVNITTEGGAVESSDNDLWLVPGAYVLTATYTITKDAFSKSYTKTATVTLVQGKNNNIGPTTSGGVELPNIGPDDDDVAEIEFNVTVTPWSDQHVDVNF